MENKNVNDILGIESTQSQRNIPTTTYTYRYPALRTISGIYMVLAWLIGIAAIIVTFYFLLKSDMKIFGLISFVFGGLLALGLAAISESIKVFIDIENNTRKN